MLEQIVELLLLIFVVGGALFFVIRKEVRKFKKLSDPTNSSGCGESCENCPFAKTGGCPGQTHPSQPTTPDSASLGPQKVKIDALNTKR